MPARMGKSYGRHNEQTDSRNASNNCPSYCSAMIWVPMSCLVLACDKRVTDSSRLTGVAGETKLGNLCGSWPVLEAAYLLKPAVSLCLGLRIAAASH